MLTALIVAMVLSAQTPWYVVTITSALAVISKYVVRTRAGNVFNPAALAIVATFPMFHAGQSWWGALPEVTPLAQIALLVGGVFIADRVNKMPLVLAFLGVYYLLFTIASFVSDPAWVSEVFRAPDLQAVLFFALFILTDPPTSPVKYRDQIVFAVIVGVASFAIFEWLGAVYYLLAGVLIGNIWEAWRRVHRRSGHAFPRGIGCIRSGDQPVESAATLKIRFLLPVPSSQSVSSFRSPDPPIPTPIPAPAARVWQSTEALAPAPAGLHTCRRC